MQRKKQQRGCACLRARGADELRQPALGGQPQFIGCYSAPTVFTASNLKEFSQILCFRMCCTDQFPAPFALCAAVCAFKGWGGVCTRQSPLKRVLRRLWAMCEKSVWIRLRRWRNEPLGRVFFLLTIPCSGGFRPLFTRSIVEQTGYNLSSRNLIWDAGRIGLVVSHNSVNDGDHLPAGVAHGRHVRLPFIPFFLKIKLQRRIVKHRR